MTTQKKGSAAFAVCGSFCAPETAGEAVARTVLAILREREECT